MENEQLQQEIEAAIQSSEEESEFEQIMDEHDSPLNRPVKEKDIGGNQGDLSDSTDDAARQQQESGQDIEGEQVIDSEPPPFDNTIADEAPEQVIDPNFAPGPESDAAPDMEIPPEHLQTMTNSFLGVTNNFLRIGGGFFVKLKKEKEFYDFEEIVQIIDDHNDRNVRRIQLDEEDMALLRPLLAQILAKKAKNLTVEQQLIGVIISILVKKVQVMVEIRSENKLLIEKIRDVIQSKKQEQSASEFFSEHEEEEEPIAEEEQPFGEAA